MNKILLTFVTSMVAMFIMVGASFADGHCNKFADIKGKAWVDGDCMETPLGEKWWPHPIWGADDQAGSTKWYKKPEVVKRALAMVKEGNTMQLGHPYTQRNLCSEHVNLFYVSQARLLVEHLDLTKLCGMMNFLLQKSVKQEHSLMA
jgi:hypothetical protein